MFSLVWSSPSWVGQHGFPSSVTLLYHCHFIYEFSASCEHSVLYQDLSMCHDWPVKNVCVDLPIKMKGNSKIHITGAPLKKVRWGGDFTSCVNIFSFTFPSFLKLNLACMNNFFWTSPCYKHSFYVLPADVVSSACYPEFIRRVSTNLTY